MIPIPELAVAGVKAPMSKKMASGLGLSVYPPLA
jgi:hypothetical protein